MEIVGFVLLAALIIFLWRPGVFFGAGIGLAEENGKAYVPRFSPTDIVTISLSAATLVLAGVAVIVSFLAVVGYTALKDVATNTAKEVAGEVAERCARETAANMAEPCARETAADVARVEVNKRLDQFQMDAADTRAEAGNLSPDEANAIAKAAGAGQADQAS